jgi:rod shape-determining protein MreD
MTNKIFINIIRFVILVFIQIFILENINLRGYINPYLYVYFILLLPFETPGWLLLISSFFLGFSIDTFVGTLGIHTAASVLMAFSRPLVIKAIPSRKDFEPGMKPSISHLGFIWFFSYAIILILIHHFALFYLEVFSFSNFFSTFSRVLLSSSFTLILVIIAQYLFFKSSGKN